MIQLTTTYKKCAYCLQEFPISNFAKSRYGDGRDYRCKQCKKKEDEIIRKELKEISENENKKQIAMTYKKCTKCSKELPVSNFYKNKARLDGMDGKCKKCRKELSEESRKKKPKSVLNIKDFSDDVLFSEVKRRGWTGTLSHTNSISL